MEMATEEESDWSEMLDSDVDAAVAGRAPMAPTATMAVDASGAAPARLVCVTRGVRDAATTVLVAFSAAASRSMSPTESGVAAAAPPRARPAGPQSSLMSRRPLTRRYALRVTAKA